MFGFLKKWDEDDLMLAKAKQAAIQDSMARLKEYPYSMVQDLVAVTTRVNYLTAKLQKRASCN